MKENTRILSFDIIRIVAILMVVLIHASAPFVVGNLPPSVDFIWGNLFDGISRAAVPLFVMLSGALMLNEKKQITKTKMIQYIKNILFLLIFWVLFYAVSFEVVIPLVHGKTIALKTLFIKTVIGHYHLWFLYLILGIYLLTPLLRLFVKKENSQYVLYFIGLSLLFHFSIPVFNFATNQVLGGGDQFISFMDRMNMGFVDPFLSYYLLGWYISNHEIAKRHRIVIYVLGLMGVLITILGCYCFTKEGIRVDSIFANSTSFHIFFYTAAIFLFIYTFFKNKKIKNLFWHHLIIQLSSLSFGVYVIHAVVLNGVFHNFFKDKSASLIPIMWMIVVILSYVIVFALSKIPYVKKLFKC